MNADTLLKANYYVGDKRTNKAMAYVNENMGYNEYGEIVTSGKVDVKQFATVHNVKYSTCIDPTPHDVEYVMGSDERGYVSGEDSYVHHLNNPETFTAVYNFLFKDPLQGNGIQILMFEDFPRLLKFGHIICQYLSMNFGVDILFIDPMYRQDCRGYSTYTGNKERGKQIIKEIRNADLLLNFTQALTSSEYYSSISNLRTHLLAYDFDTTMLLYHLLFPDDPLPPGNYSLDHIREIIIGRCTETINPVRSINGTSNLLINNWEDIIGRANQEYIDFMEDDDGADSGLF